MKKLLCVMISAVLLCTSVSSALAVNEPTDLSVSGQQVKIDPMSVVTDPPFGFEIVSVGRDSVTAEFVSEGRITDPPYVGIKGTKTAAEKTGNLQYVLEYGKKYSFAYTVTEGENEVVYNSFVTVESGESPAVVFGTVLSNMVGAEISRSAGSVYEEEDNGVWLWADWTDDDYDNYGTISSEDDVDWWRLSFPSDGVANFWLGNIPEGCDYDLYLFDEDCAGSGYGYELECSVNEDNTPELIQYEVVEGQEFFVRVESFEGYSDDSYYLFRAKVYPYSTNDIYYSARILCDENVPYSVAQTAFYEAVEAFETNFNVVFDLESNDYESSLDLSSSCSSGSDTICATTCGELSSCSSLHHKSSSKILHENISSDSSLFTIRIVSYKLCWYGWSPSRHEQVSGLGNTLGKNTVVTTNTYHPVTGEYELNYLIRHELSHNIGVVDDSCIAGEPCVIRDMDGYDSWCSKHYNQILSYLS